MQLLNAELLTIMNSAINYPKLAFSSISRKRTKTHTEALILSQYCTCIEWTHSLCFLDLKAACQVAICYNKKGRQWLPLLLM